MIERAELEQLKIISPAEDTLILNTLDNETLIKQIIDSKIQVVQNQNKKPYYERFERTHMFELEEGEYSCLDTNSTINLVKTGFLQKLAIDVMKEYGLDENIFKNKNDKKYPSLTIDEYPSQTVKDFAFRRIKEMEGDKLVAVKWEIIDRRSEIVPNLKRLFKK